MVTKTLLLMVCAVLGQLASTRPASGMQTAKWDSSAEGDLLLRPFLHAPYPHSSRQDGWKYDGVTYTAAESYSDSTVGIFIPAGYRGGDTVDYVVHFHGWSNSVAGTFERYQLKRQMFASKRNAILIVPEGPRNSRDSGGGKLEHDPGAFRALMEEITEYLNAENRIHTRKIGKIVLSTHSGGYLVTASILRHGGLTDHVTDVLLFDSSYGGLNDFANWIQEGRGRRLVSIFTAHLAPENFMLLSELQSRHTRFATGIPQEITAPMLLPRSALLFHTTDIEHDEILQKKDYFALFLQTSALSHR